MDIKEAYKKLDLSEESTIQIVRSKYNDMYNDFRMMIDNAPTPKLKESFERNLSELEDAFKLINGSNPAESTEDLPSISKTQTTSNSSESNIDNTNITDVYAFFGVSKDTDSKTIQKKYLTLVKNLELEIKKQFLPQVKQMYQAELTKSHAFWKILLKEKPDLHVKLASASSFDWTKNKVLIYSVSGILALVVVIILLLNSGVFKGSQDEEYTAQFNKAIELVSKNDVTNLLAAEKIFVELFEIEEMKERVQPWFQTIKEKKGEIIEVDNKKLYEYIEAEKFVDAQAVYNRMAKILPMTDPKLILLGKEIEDKAKKQADKIKSLISSGDKAVELFNFDAALLIYEETLKDNPSNNELKLKISSTKQKLKDYENCRANLGKAQEIVEFFSPKETLYKKAQKDIEQIKKDCPGLFEKQK
jgi:hypothetical protein